MLKEMQIYQVNTNRGLWRKWENLSKTETVLKTVSSLFSPESGVISFPTLVTQSAFSTSCVIEIKTLSFFILNWIVPTIRWTIIYFKGRDFSFGGN